jgi:hypothetical protein
MRSGDREKEATCKRSNGACPTFVALRHATVFHVPLRFLPSLPWVACLGCGELRTARSTRGTQQLDSGEEQEGVPQRHSCSVLPFALSSLSFSQSVVVASRNAVARVAGRARSRRSRRNQRTTAATLRACWRAQAAGKRVERREYSRSHTLPAPPVRPSLALSLPLRCRPSRLFPRRGAVTGRVVGWWRSDRAHAQHNTQRTLLGNTTTQSTSSTHGLWLNARPAVAPRRQAGGLALPVRSVFRRWAASARASGPCRSRGGSTQGPRHRHPTSSQTEATMGAGMHWGGHHCLHVSFLSPQDMHAAQRARAPLFRHPRATSLTCRAMGEARGWRNWLV